jgi:hypothetical protein
MPDEMKDPICDLRFLLNRGYNRESAVKFVSNKYRLGIKQRNFLVRAVFSSEEASEHKKKTLGIEDLNKKKVVVDGYNVLITVENVLKGKEVILCDDGFVRDTTAIFGKYKTSDVTSKAIEEILNVLKKSKVSEVLFIFDSQVSYSGELCRVIREKIAKAGLKGDAITSNKADFEICMAEKIVCSSDRAIIKKAEKVVDLPYSIAKRYDNVKVLPSCI